MMYKRFIFATIAVLVLVSGPFTYAEEGESITLGDEQIAAIKTNCVGVQGTLGRIFTNDASSRVHLGQEYETLLSKFMEPMNSRAAAAHYDTTDMVKLTSQFKAKLEKFRSTYQQYKDTIKRAQVMKCTDQPVVFYDTIVLAAQYRTSLRLITDEMAAMVPEYNGLVKSLHTPKKPEESS